MKPKLEKAKSMKEDITGIILAGGKSQRMGMEKGLVVFHGQPLIQRAIAVLKVLCHKILISSNTSSYDHLGYKVVHDVMHDSGPMGGIYSCLRESKSRVNLVSCDMPFVAADIYHLLANHAGDAWICVPWYENEHFEPLCGIYTKDCLPDMEAYINIKNYKLPELFLNTNFKALKIKDIYPKLKEYYFFNINSPSDLDLALELPLV